MQEILNYSQGYKVRKLTIFPGMSMALHQHEKRTEHWSIVEGVATITVGNETADYNKYESVFIPVGAKHKIANKTDKNVVVIEVGIGDNISDNDLVKIYNQDNQQVSNYVRLDKSPIIKLEPAFKDNLWGGTKIRDVYGKKCDYDVIGESWELSAHPDGQSRIAEGRYKGMLFNEYLNIIGKMHLAGNVRHRTDSLFLLSSLMQNRHFLYRFIRTMNMHLRMRMSMERTRCGM